MITHGIKVATTRTGLSGHVLRVWEKRYGAVTPMRTDTNRRLYTDADIDRLQTLSKLIKGGYSIGQIASLEDEELRTLLDSVVLADLDPYVSEVAGQTDPLIRDAVTAVRKFDQDALNRIFDEASLSLGYAGLLEFVVIPLIQKVGESWHDGSLTSAGEHAATSFIKEYLSHSVRAFAVEESAPVLVVTTPAGQLHELGAFIGSCLARKNGWEIVYLGPCLPADEIAGAVARVNATALLISIVYPMDDPKLELELRRLREQTPKLFPILVGGGAIDSYRKILTDIEAVLISDFSGLNGELLKIRKDRLAT